MFSFWQSPVKTLFYLSFVTRIFADPAVVKFSDCFNSHAGDPAHKLNIDTVYAQVLHNDALGTYLNLTLLGNSPQEIEGSTTNSGSLATLFTTTNILTLTAWSNSSYFCETLRPPSPIQPLEFSNETYCPIPAGPFALSSSIPWGDQRALTTLTTRLRAVDPSINELLCVDIETTPLDPQPDAPYGKAKIIFWFTVGLVIAYWVIVGFARIVSAWGRGISRHAGIWSRAQSAGYILASAISGERLASQPALLRFCTPSMRDIIFHTQWCAVLAMVAVEWPAFAYPLLTQAAWSTLSFNITVIPSAADHHWDPLYTPAYSPPSNFADQLNDPQSPLYIDPSRPNYLYTLPDEAKHGITSFAYTVGVRPQDLFPICLVLFLAIVAAAIVVAFIVWLVDYLACLVGGAFKGDNNMGPGTIGRLGARSPAFTSIKEVTDPIPAAAEESKSLNGHGASGASIFRPSSRFGLPLAAGGSERAMHRPWWRIRSELGSFHGSVLHGNLVRILLLFHLPITIFSAYQMTQSTSVVSMTSKALAGLSFAIFSIIIPAHLVIRVTFTTTNKLYDETRTLLSLGPLYNHYRHGSQLFAVLFFASNLVFGVTIGAGQASGTAQAIVILVVEVASALVTSIWLPWGSGASMGLISFLFCVARIVVAVLLVILSPTISIDEGAGGWVAYGILIILALVYLALLLMLIVKTIEALTRIFGGIPFNHSKHVVHSGLLGACGLLGCCGSRRRPKKRRPRDDDHSYQATPLPMLPHEYHKSGMSPFMADSPINTPVDGTPPRFLGGAGSRKGSTNSGPPASVLRPEHANQPYREDSEDEGFIMGAWQKQGYSPMADERPQAAAPSKPSTGFSRVGGGRAHIDSPYAISGGSTQAFPSSVGLGQPSTPHHPYGNADASPPPSLSFVGNAYDVSALPPGAMQPTHTHSRTKSQTAIVEDPAVLAAMQRISPAPPMQSQTTTPTTPGFLRVPANAPPPPDDDTDSIEAPKKKTPWYHIRRKLHSSDGPAASTPDEPATLPVDEEMGGLGSAAPQPQRSFVVIRKPQSLPSREGQSGPSSTGNLHATN